MTTGNAHHTNYISAMARISGEQGEPTPANFVLTVKELAQIAEAYPPAKAKLAALNALGIGGSLIREDANTLFLSAAMSGFPPAVRNLGIQLLLSDADQGVGAGLLCRAASAGDWIAGFLILRQACRGQYFLSAQNLKGLSGQLSDVVPFKLDIQTKIAALPDSIAVLPKIGFSQKTCREALADRPMRAEFHNVIHGQNPTIRPVQTVLSQLECDYLIAISCASMQSSKVVSSEVSDSVQSRYRTSDGTVLLPHMLDYPTVRILEKLSAESGIEPGKGEFLSLLRYTPGQEYLPHHDYLKEDENDYSMVKKCGQRRATLLTYLNEGYEGGETKFPKLDITFKGNAGDSLYFENTDENGTPIPNSLHAGLPVRSGEKWLATLWIREKPFWPWLR